MGWLLLELKVWIGVEFVGVAHARSIEDLDVRASSFGGCQPRAVIFAITLWPNAKVTLYRHVCSLLRSILHQAESLLRSFFLYFVSLLHTFLNQIGQSWSLHDQVDVHLSFWYCIRGLRIAAHL